MTDRLRPRNERFREVVAESFSRQTFLRLIRAELKTIEPGHVVVACPITDDLLQQAGILHAGVITTLADTACGYAVLSLAEPDCDLVSVEFKVNMLAPGRGDSVEATGDVLRNGKSLAVALGFVESIAADGTRQRIAQMQATMLVRPRQGAKANEDVR